MLAGLMLMTGCTQAQDAPTQVIYRFDAHRYLELKGWNWQGALYYVDPQRGIRSEGS
ncbi:T6SS immunity protein Tli3 family protein, partial [Escherichia coli]|uniref:T6SS immunity protein Tli3 family protein n=1 Tax=Escherichia coli TaxID=562 RepID=UPI003F4DA577